MNEQTLEAIFPIEREGELVGIVRQDVKTRSVRFYMCTEAKMDDVTSLLKGK